ncbi:mismatch repair protein PMS1 [Trypanosoma rangeli]|uniref:Mismatch repair protein PMS1 n=1 Tax=Trypanosoma rangeli TaxID=5698 RepID=A0A3R7KHA1_TRYRA|nr:mismatch repair protein PMS1 [Trypanosoma rangeli]RNF07647.1 mismatch repair protein PMS1 [Trypanosoma rangeli]|eukprot:RNF07647.1 mismatch repair protein PMS1 [Trypanosoma rangeli]
MIQRLDAASARRLSAGQVITGLPSVLKELVENSLDAGAHTVTVRLEDYGLERIVVDDDGSGMALSDLLTSEGNVKEDVCLPLLACRATTKHQQGDDDASAAQVRDLLGFRGEALHCLANLSEVTIQTMTAASQPVTLCITYDIKAHRTSVRASRERNDPGTTVVVEKLFRALPVRHREFNKNKKKQLLAATLLMKQYALSTSPRTTASDALLRPAECADDSGVVDGDKRHPACIGRSLRWPLPRQHEPRGVGDVIWHPHRFCLKD